MLKFQKKLRDKKTVKTYRKNLEVERKVYRQVFSTFTTGGQKNRAMALGAACLEGIKAIDKLVNQRPLIPFVKGSLIWNINERRVKDDIGQKGYNYSVSFNLQSYEPAWTKEEIDRMVEETKEKLRAETEEMFSKDAPDTMKLLDQHDLKAADARKAQEAVKVDMDEFTAGDDTDDPEEAPEAGEKTAE